jgi:hypothetical protein
MGERMSAGIKRKRDDDNGEDGVSAIALDNTLMKQEKKA